MDIVERLRFVGGIEGTTRWYINPDGPEAADEIERLREAMETVREFLISSEVYQAFIVINETLKGDK